LQRSLDFEHLLNRVYITNRSKLCTALKHSILRSNYDTYVAYSCGDQLGTTTGVCWAAVYAEWGVPDLLEAKAEVRGQLGYVVVAVVLAVVAAAAVTVVAAAVELAVAEVTVADEPGHHPCGENQLSQCLSNY